MKEKFYKYESLAFYFILIFIFTEISFSFISLNYIRFHDQPPETGDETWALDLALTTLEEGKPKTNVWLGSIYNKMQPSLITPWIYIVFYGVPMKIKGDIDIYSGRIISFAISLITLSVIFLITRLKTGSNLLSGMVASLPLLNYNFLYASHSCRGEKLLSLSIALLFYLFFLFKDSLLKDFLLGLYMGIFIMGLIGFPLVLTLTLGMEILLILQNKTKEKKFKKIAMFLLGFLFTLTYLYLLNGTCRLPYLRGLLNENYPEVNTFISFSQFLHSLDLKKFINDIFLIISTRVFLFINTLKFELLFFVFLFIFSLLHFWKISINSEEKKSKRRLILTSFTFFFSLQLAYFFIYPYVREIHMSLFYITFLFSILPLFEIFINKDTSSLLRRWDREIIFLSCGVLLCLNLLGSQKILKEYSDNWKLYKKYYTNHSEIANLLCNYFTQKKEKPLIVGSLAFYQYLDRLRCLHYTCYEKYFNESYPLDKGIILNFFKNNRIDYWLLTEIDYDIIKALCVKWDESFEELQKRYLERIKVFEKEVFYYNKKSTKVILYKINF